MVLRERAREMRRDVEYVIDPVHPNAAPDNDWTERFERRIRDVASRAVAHLKRGDAVALRTTTGERVRANTTVGADPILRFLALLESTPADQARERMPTEPAPPPPGTQLEQIRIPKHAEVHT